MPDGLLSFRRLPSLPQRSGVSINYTLFVLADSFIMSNIQALPSPRPGGQATVHGSGGTFFRKSILNYYNILRLYFLLGSSNNPHQTIIFHITFRLRLSLLHSLDNVSYSTHIILQRAYSSPIFHLP